MLATIKTNTLENHFQSFRENVVGYNKKIQTPFGEKNLVYADWTASGRLYRPIEEKMLKEFGPLVGNTHTETNATGTTMTLAYEEARHIIKEHVNADHENDVLILTGSGMTGAINKLIRILGWRVHERYCEAVTASIPLEERPLVFVSNMEHHSNEVAWRECIADVEYIPYCPNSLKLDLKKFEQLLEQHKDRKWKVAAVSACSNVTGIRSDYAAISRIMHQHDGYCFVDFAASAPYVSIDMHPENPAERLDAIYFSPHKFLGGPGTSGVLLFHKSLYNNEIPDIPGGGTVKWVNRWGEQAYWNRNKVEGIEAREDGGTPPFLQCIRTALSIRVKEQMGVQNILDREHELLQIVFEELNKIENLSILQADVKDRLGILSFYLNNDSTNYNLIVKLLNDHFGIQVRGGCACAGPYGHCLLGIDKDFSKSITNKIDQGDSSAKPGWVRLSVHPLMTNEEVYYILDSIKYVAENYESLKEAYRPSSISTEWRFGNYDEKPKQLKQIKAMFDI